MSTVQDFEGKQRAEAERAQVKVYIDRLQAVYDSEERKTYHSGEQKRILLQLTAMWEYYDILGRRIAEEEFY